VAAGGAVGQVLAKATATDYATDWFSLPYPGIGGVRVHTSNPITLSGPATIDGVALATGNRVLVKNQAVLAENGIYVVDVAGPWTRSADPLNTPGQMVAVSEGTDGSATVWRYDGPVLNSWTRSGDRVSLTPATGTTGLSTTLLTAGLAPPTGALATRFNGQGNQDLLLKVTGLLNIASGGTGGITAVEARTNLLPSQVGQSGKVLATNGTDVLWQTGGTGGGASALDDLTDVTITTPVQGELLTFTSGSWRNLPPASLSLDGLSDVVAPTPSTDDALIFNGTNWTSQPINLTLDKLGDVTITAPVGGDTLVYTGSQWVADAPLPFFIATAQDVTLVNPLGGELLMYNGTRWVNSPPLPVWLDALTDVQLTSPQGGELLRFNGSYWFNDVELPVWLDKLTDVVITAPAGGDILTFTGTEWRNYPRGTEALSSLSDVDLTSPSNGQALVFDGAVWRNYILSLDILGDVVLTGIPAAGQVLTCIGGGTWTNATPTPGPLNALIDVDTAGAQDGDLLTYQGGSWIPQAAQQAPAYQAVVATAGQQVIDTAVATVANAQGRAYLQVFRNGVLQREGSTRGYQVSGDNQLSFVVPLNAGDEVDIYAFT